jgi:TfoX/Sxy family transcriptional regulator of competence genes
MKIEQIVNKYLAEADDANKKRKQAIRDKIEDLQASITNSKESIKKWEKEIENLKSKKELPITKEPLTVTFDRQGMIHDYDMDEDVYIKATEDLADAFKKEGVKYKDKSSKYGWELTITSGHTEDELEKIIARTLKGKADYITVGPA